MKTTIFLGAILTIACGIIVQAWTRTDGPIYVTLWFDTEDYVLPQSDDAAKRLAEMLTRLGVPATFKVVGEKARVLEKRGRQDVIAALKRHEIGYHANTHSGQPTIAVYLQHTGWEDGAAEFYRREASGVKDIERIFGVTPVCYGQPGSAWASQTYPALKRMGIRMYLDESDHVGIDEQPFYYGNMFNVTKMRSNTLRMELGEENNLGQAQARFKAIAEKLRARGGGTISIYYHPCEFVHREFWDGVNFRRGASPLPHELKLPPMQSEAEIARNYRDFEQFVKFLKSQSGVRFVTGEQLMNLYSDRAAGHDFSKDEIASIARAVQKEISFFKLSGSGLTLSAAEAFSLLTRAAAGNAGALRVEPLFGPANRYQAGAGSRELTDVRREEFLRTVRDVNDFLRAHGRIPDQVWIGTNTISPEDYLATLGSMLEALPNTPDRIAIRRGNFTAGRFVADDSPRLWGWVIFPEGFHAPRIMELAKLQAWTLKPASLRN